MGKIFQNMSKGALKWKQGGANILKHEQKGSPNPYQARWKVQNIGKGNHVFASHFGNFLSDFQNYFFHRKVVDSANYWGGGGKLPYPSSGEPKYLRVYFVPPWFIAYKSLPNLSFLASKAPQNVQKKTIIISD